MSDNQKTRSSGASASFGFREVPENDRQGLVNDVFTTVADRYDLMNDLMSGGVHRIWKDHLITQLAPPKGGQPFHLLDVAGGTADIALRFLSRGGSGCRVTLCDINPEMLSVGRSRITKAGYQDRAEIIEGNAEALPFDDRSFDAYTIAFGIRNVTHIDQALREAYRVLKPGGHFLCLEFSQCQMPGLDTLYDLHSFHVIPRLGRLTTGSSEPYQYLVESIRKFPNQDVFARMVREAGFERVNYQNLSAGITAVHSGWRL